jgi:hypothetical protein
LELIDLNNSAQNIKKVINQVEDTSDKTAGSDKHSILSSFTEDMKIWKESLLTVI